METIIKKERPKVLNGSTYQIETGCGKLYVTINSIVNNNDKKSFELFATIGKTGGCAASQTEAIGRIISLALRSGVQIKHLVKQLSGISCHAHVGMGEEKVTSCADAISKVIKLHLSEEEKRKIIATN